jgi:hypothetical protein
MRKVNGVAAVEVRLNEGLTILDLKADNHITLAELRKVIRNNGFVPKETVIEAAGTVDGAGFNVSGTNESLKPTAKPVALSNGRWKFAVAAK